MNLWRSVVGPADRGSAGGGAVGLLRGPLPSLAHGVAKKAEEIRVGLQQHARVVGVQAVLVGLHRAVECKEFRIISVCLSENAIAFGITLTANLFALLRCFSKKHGDLAIRLRADLLGALASLGAIFG